MSHRGHPALPKPTVLDLPQEEQAAMLAALRRALLALLKTPPRAYGGCRTRWSGASLALTRPTTRGMPVSAETMRRWLHTLGWVWKRATRVAKDDNPQRIDRLARIRYVFPQLKSREIMLLADERDSHLWPTVGGAWMPKGTPLEVMMPGQNQTHNLAGALELTTGTRHHCLGPRKTHALFRDLLTGLDARDPVERYTRLDVVVDHDKIHQAKAVEDWLAAHPQLPLLCWPTYGPRANPIERALGDVHDCCRRNHQRPRLPDRVADVAEPLELNAPWQYQRSELDDEPAVTVAVEKIAAEEQANAAA